jgi:hypothetical protein
MSLNENLPINTNPGNERSVTNVKLITSTLTRVRRFLTGRYRYKEQPEYLVELVAFGIIIIAALLSLPNAMATLKTPRGPFFCPTIASGG